MAKCFRVFETETSAEDMVEFVRLSVSGFQHIPDVKV